MVIIYSKTGNSKKCGELLADILHHTIAEVKTKKELGFISALFTVFFNKYPEVDNIPKTDDDKIYLCGPIWASSMATPLMTVLSKMDLKDKEVNAALTLAGTLNANDLQKIEEKILAIVAEKGGKMGKVQAFTKNGKEMDLDILKEHLAATYL